MAVSTVYFTTQDGTGFFILFTKLYLVSCKILINDLFDVEIKKL